jgi:hypothetical protein
VTEAPQSFSSVRPPPPFFALSTLLLSTIASCPFARLDETRGTRLIERAVPLPGADQASVTVGGNCKIDVRLPAQSEVGKTRDLIGT